jgi:hypothetical protein
MGLHSAMDLGQHLQFSRHVFQHIPGRSHQQQIAGQLILMFQDIAGWGVY